MIKSFSLSPVGSAGAATVTVDEGVPSGAKVLGVAVAYPGSDGAGAGVAAGTVVTLYSRNPTAADDLYSIWSVTGNTAVPFRRIMVNPVKGDNTSVTTWFVEPICVGDLVCKVTSGNAGSDQIKVVVLLDAED